MVRGARESAGSGHGTRPYRQKPTVSIPSGPTPAARDAGLGTLRGASGPDTGVVCAVTCRFQALLKWYVFRLSARLSALA